MTTNRCPFAIQSPARRKRWRTIEPWGLVVHTSGRGIVGRAEKQRVPPLALALAWYRRRGGVHYVIGYDGTIHQMLDDDRRGAHVGISLTERATFLSGRWLRKGALPPKAVALWQARWPAYKSPQHLYPTQSPNGCYLGVELVPLAERRRENGLWFTDAQHGAVRDLATDIEIRHRFPGNWRTTPRLVGHEDIDAFGRWDPGGGWDPGAMRQKPRFDWGRIIP